MSKNIHVHWVLFSLVLIALCGLTHQTAMGADTNPLAAQVTTFSHPDGSTYFALSLKPNVSAVSTNPRDVVILFNTSASQAGPFRAKAMDALKAALADLNANDRVQLMAMDLNAVPLTQGFVAPNGKEMADALAALDARVPLGATDMEKALTAVTASFAGDSKNPRSVLCIGDGRSMANVLGTAQFKKLAATLAHAKISVSSYVLGTRVDLPLPNALAMNTGGNVVVDDGNVTASDAGKRLASMADAMVYWPTSVKFSDEVTEVYPEHTPPLRSDRDTVVVGELKSNQPFNVEMAVESASGPASFTYAAPAGVSDEVNNYLARLVEVARADGGASMPLVDSSSLESAKQEMSAITRSVSRLAQQALSSGNVDGAKKIIDEALRQDPNDPEAISLRNALEKRISGEVPAAASQKSAFTPAPAKKAPAPTASSDSDLNLVGPSEASGETPDGTLMEGVLHDKRVVAQVVQAEVANALSKSRSQMGSDPDSASQQLRLTLERVRKTAELNPEVREQFQGQLEIALREAARQKVEVENARQHRLESEAAANERLLLTENLTRNQQKLTQLMSRFDALMEEGRYRLAEESAGAAAQKMVIDKEVPPTPVPAMAITQAQLVGRHADLMAIRTAREKAFADVFYQVDKSNMPFPDEPPLIYPAAEVWQQLTIRRKAAWSAVDLAKRSPAEKKIEAELKKPTQFEFSEQPLSAVIDYLKEYHKIEIQADTRALEEASVALDTPITMSLHGVSLRSALKRLLKNLDLTYTIQDEVLLITTTEKAESADYLETKVYPVADLVIPVQSGGGNMGGMGGMGGMGNSMGGGMNGMGGGGMYNLPKDILPSLPKEGFQAFNVKDEIKDTPAQKGDENKAIATVTPSTVAPSASVAESNAEKTADAAVNRPEKIDVQIQAGVNPELFWNEYFSKNEPQPAAVRDAVRRLMREKKFDHVIALVGSALRNRQVQPWMYEAMTMALDAAGRPKEEVERAVMSAVDFAETPSDLMFVGAYLAKLGLNERALQIYRQVAELDPLRPEPYMLGLKAARAVDNLDGLKWVSLGILGQAWPKQQNDIWQAGVGVAKEVVERLKKENREAEAKEFQAAVDQAIQRDCVAIVTYTGEGEIDLMVQEPCGTLCSLRNARTMAGGVMLGDEMGQTGRDSLGGHSEVYVCPKGFDGAYRLVARRVWGHIIGGKVNVEVITHFNTGESSCVKKKIVLENDEAVVVFTLDKGRRTEALQDEQLANAVNNQIALNRQILAQETSTSSSSGSTGLAETGTSGGVTTANSTFPFFRSGVVGYQPVIQSLSQGASLMVTAVVSADRRYVRITPRPMFSGVSQVNTFNMANGTSTSSTSSSSGAMGSSGGYSGTSSGNSYSNNYSSSGTSSY
jgi:tetratricopeptide (TPR) repeat protein